jgi:chitin elicitor receptor kinase 1
MDCEQRLAIKRMNLQASKEFMAELKILTHVHHTNLVPYNFLPLITHP